MAGPDQRFEQFGLDAFGSASSLNELNKLVADADRGRFARFVADLTTTRAESEFAIGDLRVWVRGYRTGTVIVLLMIDVTSNTSAREASRIEALIRAAADVASDALIVFDAIRDDTGEIIDFTIIHANRQSEPFTQHTIDQVLGQRASNALDWKRVERVIALMRRALKRRSMQPRELRIGSGEDSRWYSARAIPIDDSVALSLIDLTSQKKSAALISDQQKLNQQIIDSTDGAEDFVRQAAELFRRAEALSRENATLKDIASIDELTKVYNRREFEIRLRAEVDRVVRYGGDFSVVVVDIDNFKVVNDTYGHQYGDTVLHGFAQIVVGCKREPDVVSRYGGEEFVIILPEVNLDGAIRFAERVREKLHATEIGDQNVRVTGSFGCAQHRPGESGADVVKRADAVQYEAKRAGKDRVYADRVI